MPGDVIRVCLGDIVPLRWLALAQVRQPASIRRGPNVVAELPEHFASHLELPCPALRPLLSAFSQIVVSTREVSRGGITEIGASERCLEPALSFGKFCQDDLLRGHSPKPGDETYLGQNPDDPFRWIDLPGFHSIPVIMLKLVMIVMITLAEGKDCEEPRVASTAF